MERRREKRLFVGREERREKKREEGGTQSSNQLVHFLIPATRWNSIKLAKLEGKTGTPSVGRSLWSCSSFFFECWLELTSKVNNDR